MGVQIGLIWEGLTDEWEQSSVLIRGRQRESFIGKVRESKNSIKFEAESTGEKSVGTTEKL